MNDPPKKERHKSSSFKPSHLWHLFLDLLRYLLRHLLWHLLWHLLGHLLGHLMHLLRHHRRYVGWRAQPWPSTQSAQGSSTHGVEGWLLTNVTCTWFAKWLFRCQLGRCKSRQTAHVLDLQVWRRVLCKNKGAKFPGPWHAFHLAGSYDLARFLGPAFL